MCIVDTCVQLCVKTYLQMCSVIFCWGTLWTCPSSCNPWMLVIPFWRKQRCQRHRCSVCWAQCALWVPNWFWNLTCFCCRCQRWHHLWKLKLRRRRFLQHLRKVKLRSQRFLQHLQLGNQMTFSSRSWRTWKPRYGLHGLWRQTWPRCWLTWVGLCLEVWRQTHQQHQRFQGMTLQRHRQEHQQWQQQFPHLSRQRPQRQQQLLHHQCQRLLRQRPQHQQQLLHHQCQRLLRQRPQHQQQFHQQLQHQKSQQLQQQRP